MKQKDIKIFIIAGKGHTGKDTTARFIKSYAENKNLKVASLGFSSYIKNYAKEISNWDGKEETKPRTLLQDIGELARTNIDNNFFIDRTINDIKILSYFVDIITISDARFPEELDLIKNTFPNSYKIKIERPNYNSNLTEAQKNHRTEIALDNYNDFDYQIINDGTLDDLNQKIINIINKII